MTPVVWSTEALDRLADIYVAASPSEREVIAACVESANLDLQDSPRTKGESREGRKRVAFYGRLVVFFYPADGTAPTKVFIVRWRGRRHH